MGSIVKSVSLFRRAPWRWAGAAGTAVRRTPHAGAHLATGLFLGLFAANAGAAGRDRLPAAMLEVSPLRGLLGQLALRGEIALGGKYGLGINLEERRQRNGTSTRKAANSLNMLGADVVRYMLEYAGASFFVGVGGLYVEAKSRTPNRDAVVTENGLGLGAVAGIRVMPNEYTTASLVYRTIDGSKTARRMGSEITLLGGIALR